MEIDYMYVKVVVAAVTTIWLTGWFGYAAGWGFGRATGQKEGKADGFTSGMKEAARRANERSRAWYKNADMRSAAITLRDEFENVIDEERETK